MKISQMIFISGLLFLVVAVAGIPYDFVTKWEPESACAQPRPGNSRPGNSHPGNSHPGDSDLWNIPDPLREDSMPEESNPWNSSQSVPEPSILILLGTGLAVFGGYSVFRFKNKGK